MPRRLRNLAGELTKLNLQIKHNLQQAEAKVSHINSLIAELAQQGGLSRAVLLGKYRELPYDPDAAPPARARVIQAVLLVPEGFGICEWESTDAYRPDQEPQHFNRDACEKFRPFAELDEADMLFVLPQMETLLEELVTIAEGVSTEAKVLSS